MDSKKLVDFLLESKNCPEMWDSGRGSLCCFQKHKNAILLWIWRGVPCLQNQLYVVFSSSFFEISLSAFRSLLKWSDAYSKFSSLFLNIE